MSDFFAQSTLLRGISASALNIELPAGGGDNFPQGRFWSEVSDAALAAEDDPDREIILVIARKSDQLELGARGQGGTTAATHNTAGHTYRVRLAITANDSSAFGSPETTGRFVIKATAAAMKAMPVGDSSLLVIIKTPETGYGRAYLFDPDSDETPDTYTIIDPDSGSGQFILFLA